MERETFFTSLTNKDFEISIFLKFVHRFKAITLKFPKAFFLQIQKPKIYKEMQKPR